MTAQEMMKSWQKFVQPDHQVLFIQVTSWNCFALVKTCVGITTSQPQYRSESKTMPTVQCAGPKKVSLYFRFSRVFQKNGGEKQWNASVFFFSKHTRQNWQTECHRTKEDVAPKSRSHKTCHVEQKIYSSNLYESSSIWYKDASRNVHRIRAEFWRRLDPTLDHRGQARH